MTPSDALPPPDDLALGDGPGVFGPIPDAPAGLEDRVERATTRRVARRALRRRAVAVLGLAAAYLAGAATAPWSGRGAPGGAVEATGPTGVAAATVPGAVAPMDPVSMAARLRERGDRLLAETGDVEGALALYREHLELASLAGRPASDPADSWLLSALKNEIR